MTDPRSRLLPESVSVEDYVDDPEFTEVTSNGEVYTLYRIVRMTHELLDDPSGWTHLANVVRVRVPAIGTAQLRIDSRIITNARVTVNRTLD